MTRRMDAELDAELNAELEQLAQAELARDSVPHQPAAPGLVRIEFPREDRNLAVGVHLGTLAATILSGGFLAPILLPLCAHSFAKERSQALGHHVKEQLNFQLTLATVAILAVLGSVVTFGIGILIAVPLMVFFLAVETVASIKGALAASRGEQYEFPFTIDYLK